MEENTPAGSIASTAKSLAYHHGVHAAAVFLLSKSAAAVRDALHDACVSAPLQSELLKAMSHAVTGCAAPLEEEPWHEPPSEKSCSALSNEQRSTGAAVAVAGSVCVLVAFVIFLLRRRDVDKSRAVFVERQEVSGREPALVSPAHLFFDVHTRVLPAYLEHAASTTAP